MHSWRRLSTLTAIALAASALAQAAPPTIDAIVSLRRPSEPALSPDGRAVAYSVLETDWDANEFRTQLWLVDVASAVSRPLTSAKGSSSAPAWSPDGRTLAFLSDRSGKSQVWLMAAAG